MFATVAVLVLSAYGFATSEPKYLFKGYDEYVKIAEENKDLKFVFVGDIIFNQIQNIEEFMIYKESLILSENQLEYLLNNEGLKGEKEIVVSIKKYLGADELFEKVLQFTGAKDFSLLLDDPNNVACKIYKLYL